MNRRNSVSFPKWYAVFEIAAPTLNTLFFGNPDLRNEANESVFLAVVFHLENKAFPGTLINTYKYQFFYITFPQ